ncbi:MAG: DUF1295 domain-containing protein [Saprospiraceae bacterium]
MNPHLVKNTKFGKMQSLGLVLMAYVLAYMAAELTFLQFGHLGDIYGILVANIAATFVIYFLGLFVQNASLYDPYWSVVPVGLAVYWWSISDYDMTDMRKILLMIVLLYWSVRLTFNWVRGWAGFIQEDWRYEMLRDANGKWYPFVNLGGIHLIPTLLVFLGMIPTYFVLYQSNNPLNEIDYLAFLIGIIAVTIELIADEQMKEFNSNPTNHGKIMKSGLWKYSRHPNYFGEILFWVSMFLFAYAAGHQYLWTIVGVGSMLILFLFGSIPMMDKRSKIRRPGFKEYVRKTSKLIFLPPKK